MDLIHPSKGTAWRNGLKRKIQKKVIEFWEFFIYFTYKSFVSYDSEVFSLSPCLMCLFSYWCPWRVGGLNFHEIQFINFCPRDSSLCYHVLRNFWLNLQKIFFSLFLKILKFLPLWFWVNFWICYKIQIDVYLFIYSFRYGYPIVLALFVERTVLSSLLYLYILLKINWSYMRNHFWTLYLLEMDSCIYLSGYF
jgi:hypothetical protein